MVLNNTGFYKTLLIFAKNFASNESYYRKDGTTKKTGI